MTEAIITQLGDLPRLTVKSRFLVRRFRDGAADARVRVAALLRDLPRDGPLEMWMGSGLATAVCQLGDQ